ncbi:topoisomerase I binding, arginine/serine-rich a [Triplophysa dalaica]|uniref:topoisomerase I binding, arginine/serine-rich a n=1 Tax=Triplophysa dalaica TaxID=1582913 RepID=UPI0024DF940A|nr:topoisomerase I binding, arginine/serine-rich a [Triplophysa dalaica]
MAQTETKEDLLKDSTNVELHNTLSKEASPESKCPICLDHFKNISYLNVCLHKFCFLCVREWSKNKAECPLCKQPFRSIYHTIKAENDYKRFDLPPTENGSFGNVAGQRFRYRTTVTGDHRPAPRRTSPPHDHGILFEGMSGSLPEDQNRDLHRMMRRMAARRRAESEGRSVRSLREQEVVKFRRALYRRGVRVQSVRDGGRSRETSAEFFRKNPACLHRLVPWLRRELTVLYGTHGSFANILQHIIMTLITRHNLDDHAVLHELRPFLLSHTEHFLHEFLSFGQSPFNMEAYDQHALYDLPGPSTESSSSDTSVIDISEEESDTSMPEAQDFTTPRVTLSQTAWDDETPGPSYSSEPSQVFPVHVSESDSDSSVEEAVVSVAAVTRQDHSSDSDEDCVIVGYVKSVAERTPELVQLSSDSEEPEENEEPQRARLPQHIRFTSESPIVTRRHSQSSRRGSYSPEDTTHIHTSNRARLEDNSDRTHHKRELSKERSAHRNRTHASSHKDKREKRREKEPSHGTPSYWHSYSHHRESGRRYYSETHSSYTTFCRRGYDPSCSQSQSRRQSKDRQRFRSRSWSNSRISSSSSKHHGRSHSRSNSRINSSSSRLTSNYDEDGRKRKYKTKHLEERSRWSSEKSDEYHRKKKKKEKKHHKKSKKKSGSPSIDTVYDDKSEHSRKHQKKRKKQCKKSKRHKSKGRAGSQTPDLITITTDSDGGNTDPAVPSDRNVCPVSSTVIVTDNATETQLVNTGFVDVAQEATAANECSSDVDAGNHHQKD